MEIMDKLLKPLSGFIEKIGGPSVDQLGVLLAERIQLYRWKKQIKLLEETKVYCMKNNISIKALPLKTLFPLLESATLEDDDEMFVN